MRLLIVYSAPVPSDLNMSSRCAGYDRHFSKKAEHMVPGLRRNAAGQKREKSAFREYAESIIFAVVLALILRQFVVQAFKIPSGSMEDTLLIGDHILVNKFLYHFTDPKQFDVIVFRYPGTTSATSSSASSRSPATGWKYEAGRFT